ncbi:MAG: hypothetical protein IK127_00425 [Clostridia bacterium]|nr:hypothetical protein [Clostridia bacterium]
MIVVTIDEFTPCLKNMETGEIVETEVIRLRRKSFLSKYNQRTGWYVNWSKFHADAEIYALVIKGTVDIQGLIALEDAPQSKAVHILWAVAAPQNNVYRYGKKLYAGVGGHLFAIVGNRSVKLGYGGLVYGEAMDQAIMEHYIANYGAEYFPYGMPKHPYRIIIDTEPMKRIREEYTYEYYGYEEEI